MFRRMTAIARGSRIRARSYAAASSSPSPSPSPSPLEPSKPTHSPSLLKPGTTLKDLGILKDKPDPVALPDDEYPTWLWTLTDEYVAAAARRSSSAAPQPPQQTREQGQGGKSGGGFDLKAEKKKLRATNRADIKSRNFLRTT
ncbi:hypothetical protein QFC21_003646 [Naganishia friedmannii]|uniref:Uncharacterized protein n=1 Tax=Naganishia friedmannii TaxID=89922 RepID=A0ACC2VNW2_9TREE|nr:hypothetical protein QFC21_003646 [Naganishia friedmannii]